MKTMEFKGFQAQIMKAQRLIGSGTHSLPPGSAIDVYPVDAFENPLSNWLKGPGNYVVPVDSDWGLWFNWTLNDEMNTSVLLSIKGMNPITGQRTNGFGLERYESKCPIHNEDFKDGLFCEKCNFKWPSQNYVAFPNKLWWDGFRTPDGKVRQFFFTEELAKSIPELVIGKEDTIPAFGFAFFRPKVRRETPVRTFRGNIISSGIGGQSIYDIKLGNNTAVNQVYFCDSSGEAKSSGSLTKGGPVSAMGISGSSYCAGIGTPSPEASLAIPCAASHVSFDMDVLYEVERCFTPQPLKKIQKKSKTSEVGVGAGAIIDQKLTIDSLKVSDWESEPASIMRLYFVFIDQFKEIEAKGMKNLIGEPEGFMSGLPVG